MKKRWWLVFDKMTLSFWYFFGVMNLLWLGNKVTNVIDEVFFGTQSLDSPGSRRSCWFPGNRHIKQSREMNRSETLNALNCHISWHWTHWTEKHVWRNWKKHWLQNDTRIKESSKCDWTIGETWKQVRPCRSYFRTVWAFLCRNVMWITRWQSQSLSHKNHWKWLDQSLFYWICEWFFHIFSKRPTSSSPGWWPYLQRDKCSYALRCPDLTQTSWFFASTDPCQRT